MCHVGTRRKLEAQRALEARISVAAEIFGSVRDLFDRRAAVLVERHGPSCSTSKLVIPAAGVIAEGCPVPEDVLSVSAATPALACKTHEEMVAYRDHGKSLWNVEDRVVAVDVIVTVVVVMAGISGTSVPRTNTGNIGPERPLFLFKLRIHERTNSRVVDRARLSMASWGRVQTARSSIMSNSSSSLLVTHLDSSATR